MEIENFQLPVWIITHRDGRSFSGVRDEKQFVPICDNEHAAHVFMEQNEVIAPNLATKPVSSLPHLLRVLLGSRDNGCKFLGRISPSGSMKLIPIDLAIDALQGQHKLN